MRFTKIIATIGPATADEKAIRALAEGGVAVARLNFSHGDERSHEKTLRVIAKLNAEGRYPMAVMIDTKGPEIRTGDVKKSIAVRKDEKVIFTAKPKTSAKHRQIAVDHPKFALDARKATTLMIDNGSLEFQIVEIIGDQVIARALEDGSIGSRRHVNLPGATISLPSHTEKDWRDISFGIAHGADFIAASFIRRAEDIDEVRGFLRQNKSSAAIIAKIETAEAIARIGDIIDASDGIMVARGDLGAELPFELVPRLQDQIVRLCRQKNKTVIIATHMLESMIGSPNPTRAEATDVAHAAISQADATMLSGETASGQYPFKAVAAMSRILEASERVETGCDSALVKHDDDLPRYEQAQAAAILARNVQADALLIFTRHGRTARAVSHFRPLVPLLAFTESDGVARQLLLTWGVQPFRIAFSANPEATVQIALTLIKKQQLLGRGQRIVVVSDIVSKSKPVMTIQIRNVE